MSSLSTIISQMSSSQLAFNSAIKNKITQLKAAVDSVAGSLGLRDQPGGYVGIDQDNDSRIQRDGYINRDLFVGRNLSVAGTSTLTGPVNITGTLTLNGGTIESGGGSSADAIVMAIALG